LTKPLGPRKIFRGKKNKQKNKQKNKKKNKKNQEQEEPRTGARKTRTRKQQIRKKNP